MQLRPQATRIILSPYGRLFLEGTDLEPFRELKEAFRKGPGYGLLALDAFVPSKQNRNRLDDSYVYWKNFARLYLSLFTSIPDIEEHDFHLSSRPVELPQANINRLLYTIPAMPGAEYVTRYRLLALWSQMQAAMHQDLIASSKSLADFLVSKHPHWGLNFGICFHLTENRDAAEQPFNFFATYFYRSHHHPLSHALQTYTRPEQQKTLVRLLTPIQMAADKSQFLQKYIESGQIFKSTAWTRSETYRFIQEIPDIEAEGIIVKVPATWKEKHPGRPQIGLRIGNNPPQRLGFNALLDFTTSVLIDDDELNPSEVRDLTEKSNDPDHLIYFKERWVEVDQAKLSRILASVKANEEKMQDGVTFAEGLRLLAGVREKEHTKVVSGKWLEETLKKIREPGFYDRIDKDLKGKLKAKLRPYQKQGVAWLHLLNQLGLGGILADDMGLGKTIQVISLFLIRKIENGSKTEIPTLLVVPASLIGNWASEIKKFAPSLKAHIAHPSADGTEPPKKKHDFVITSYGSVARLQWILDTKWDYIVLDEAQAIKTPSSKQTRSIKQLQSRNRLALTGTPVENHPSDLWSLFDFLAPGLLGSNKEFKNFMKTGSKGDEGPYASLRRLVQPYILRRLKTDKTIITDLPEKTEVKTYCSLTRQQVGLYQRTTQAMQTEIKNTTGIKRRGMILTYLMRFKQICNHPSHYTKDGQFSIPHSGKFQRLLEICESIAERQEKVLVFTQFKEMAEPLAKVLKKTFGREGLILHGSVAIKKRQRMVEQFQEEDGPPFFVLSLKAGGTGLTLTAAAHVIHFDRWWNPAVERQATDRSFRIGQNQNVLVHKFICKGTLEEKIDAMIDSKQNLSEEILEGGDGTLLTELADKDLLNLVSLDISSAKSGQ